MTTGCGVAVTARPKLLQPRPGEDTRRPEAPTRRCDKIMSSTLAAAEDRLPPETAQGPRPESRALCQTITPETAWGRSAELRAAPAELQAVPAELQAARSAVQAGSPAPREEPAAWSAEPGEPVRRSPELRGLQAVRSRAERAARRRAGPAARSPARGVRSPGERRSRPAEPQPMPERGSRPTPCGRRAGCSLPRRRAGCPRSTATCRTR